jgi:hypothetical protein
MGMFDTITIKDTKDNRIELPWTSEMCELNLHTKIPEFQTKDLISCMANYSIVDGRLLLQRSGERWEDQNYHGNLSLYTYVQDQNPGKYDCWVEFRAIFTNGQLERYELVNFEKSDNTNRINSENEYIRLIQIINAKWYNKYLFHTTPWRWLRRWVWYEFWVRAGDFCRRMSYLTW